VSWMYYISNDKLRWASEVVSSHRVILGREWGLGLPYAGYYVLRERYYALRSEARLYPHSESAPRWVKNATQKYYALLSYVHSESAPRWVKNATERYWDLRRKYGYGWLRYNYELARAHREIRRKATP
jgi:hypothetical protein